MDVDVQELCLERAADACLVVRDWIGGWKRELPAAVAPDVELLTHELVANAFRHSSTQRVWVTALVLPESVVVQVTDEGVAGEPHIRAIDAYAESGRGLRWVSRLARAWGVYRRNATGVWFKIDFPSVARAS